MATETSAEIDMVDLTGDENGWQVQTPLSSTPSPSPPLSEEMNMVAPPWVDSTNHPWSFPSHTTGSREDIKHPKYTLSAPASLTPEPFPQQPAAPARPFEVPAPNMLPDTIDYLSHKPTTMDGPPYTPDRKPADRFFTTPQSQCANSPTQAYYFRQVGRVSTTPQTFQSPTSTPGSFGKQARSQLHRPNQPVQLPPTNEEVHTALEKVKTLLDNISSIIPMTTDMAKRIKLLEEENRKLKEQVKSLRVQTGRDR